MCFLSGSIRAQVGFSGLKAGGAAANSRPCVWFLSLVFAVGPSYLPVVILLWYVLAIGKGLFSRELGLSNADSFFLSCFNFW